MVMGDSGIFVKANIAKENTNYADAKESLQLMLIEIKTRVTTEEKRKTVVTDCNELDGKDEITKIEYISEEIATTEIINIDNPKYALITYRNYIFKIDNTLNIIGDSKKEEQKDEVIVNGGRYIYNQGEVANDAVGFVGTNDVNSEYAINEDSLYMNINEKGGNNFTYIGTQNKINLTNYTKIKCLVSTGNIEIQYSGNYFCLALNDSQLPSYLDAPALAYKSSQIGINKTEYVLEFEIPDKCFNKEYYIGVAGCVKDVYVYKIWLEK